MRFVILSFILFSSLCLASFQEKGIQFALDEILASKNYILVDSKVDSERILIQYDDNYIYYNGVKRSVIDKTEAGWFEATLELLNIYLPQSVSTRKISTTIKKIEKTDETTKKSTLSLEKIFPSIHSAFSYQFSILNSDGERGDSGFVIGGVEFEKLFKIGSSSEILYTIEATFTEESNSFYIKHLYYLENISKFQFKLGVIPNILSSKSDSIWRYRFFVKDGEVGTGISNISDVGVLTTLKFQYFETNFGVLSGVGYKNFNNLSEGEETLFFDAQFGKNLFIGLFGDYSIDSSENSYKAVFYTGFLSKYFKIYYRFIYKSDKSTGDKKGHILSTSLNYDRFSMFFRGFIWDQNEFNSNDDYYNFAFGLSYLEKYFSLSLYAKTDWIGDFNQSLSIFTTIEFWF
ncbi:hypothetical protein JXR93_01290 [bacterium]|nr:hypothetical protein [bacterium]